MPMPVYSFIKFLDRFFMGYFWVYPLLYYWWVSSRRLREQESYDKSVSSIMNTFNQSDDHIPDEFSASLNSEQQIADAFFG
jgi:hypothetical protein